MKNINRNHNGIKALLAVLVGTMLVLSACGATGAVGPAGKDGVSGGQIIVTLKDTSIVLDKTSVAAGTVTFKVQNAGTIAHEFVVLKTDVAVDKLAAGAEASRVDETGNQGESGDLAAGKSATFTLNLNSGHYVLVCNFPGHYAMGMRIAFTVN